MNLIPENLEAYVLLWLKNKFLLNLPSLLDSPPLTQNLTIVETPIIVTMLLLLCFIAPQTRGILQFIFLIYTSLPIIL